MDWGKILTAVAIFSAALCGGEENMRIVSLAPALTELVCHLGAERFLVGRSAACDYPGSVKKIPAAGRFGTPEIERILAQKPTLVIANDMMNFNVARQLRRSGITVEVRQIDSLEDYRRWVEFLGKKLNVQAAAQKEIKRTETLLKQLSELSPLDKKVLFVVNGHPVMAAGKGSLPDLVLQLVKTENVSAGSLAYFRCSQEWLFNCRADIMIWAAPGKPDIRGALKHLPAVRNGKIIKNISRDPVLRPGPRFLESVLKLRKKLETL